LENEKSRNVHEPHTILLESQQFLGGLQHEINQKLDTNLSLLNISLDLIGQGIQNNLIMMQGNSERTLIFLNENFSPMMEMMQHLMAHVLDIRTNNQGMENLLTSILPIWE
jgi:hypothetical protein